MIVPQDKELFAKKGIPEEQIAEQLACFEKGFSYLKLFTAASMGQGILAPDAGEQKRYLNIQETYTQTDKTAVKFVPVSGTASRMFRNLFEFPGADYDAPQSGFEKTFLGRVEKFVSYSNLNVACLRTAGRGVPALLAAGDYKTAAAVLPGSAGLDYGAFPKGLLEFHKYEDGARTPLEKHLVEGTFYAASKDGKVNVHFTIFPEHRILFKAPVDEGVAAYAEKYGVGYDISFSEQEPSTDTVAANMENRPFRDSDKLLFRPGGHGVLIEDLSNFDADTIFIKNIDNVVPDKLKGDTVLYKKLTAGVLITLQQQAFVYLQLLNSGKYTYEQVLDILQFVQERLFRKDPETKSLEDAELAIYLKNKLNRPMYVCGIVKSVGESGGDPFLVYNSNGTISLQILKSSQIDMNDLEKKDMFEKGTHFNPMDSVCVICDYKGHKFDLVKYTDKATGFISYKSRNDKGLETLRPPGLWNGAMSDQNTVFVEVLLITPDPVKTVNDSLREQHQ